MIPRVSERALVLAPQGRDAAVACAMLEEAGIRGYVCRGLAELVGELVSGAGFALVTEEALHEAGIAPLVYWARSSTISTASTKGRECTMRPASSSISSLWPKLIRPLSTS